jgi:hypothetical protein
LFLDLFCTFSDLENDRMKLPNAEMVVIEREKIVNYLLNTAHPYGVSKARFFAGFGFRVEKWELLADALRHHGLAHEVSLVRETGFGPRYQIEGQLNAPDGRLPLVRSVWQQDRGAVAPRLITAYPLVR